MKEASAAGLSVPRKRTETREGRRGWAISKAELTDTELTPHQLHICKNELNEVCLSCFFINRTLIFSFFDTEHSNLLNTIEYKVLVFVHIYLVILHHWTLGRYWFNHQIIRITLSFHSLFISWRYRSLRKRLQI